MAELGNKDLSSRVIEAAINVHKALGPGFLESVYEAAFCLELEQMKISFERQKSIKLYYRETEIGEHRLGVLVDRKLLVELKAVRELEDIFFVIGRSQMKAAGIKDGLILNFQSMPLTIRRIAPEQIGAPT